jgi:hypothetical protein
MGNKIRNVIDRIRNLPPAVAEVRRMIGESSFVRNKPRKPNTIIQKEGISYKIERVKKGHFAKYLKAESKGERLRDDLTQVQDLLASALGPDEVDDEKILRSAVEGKTPEGEQDITKYAVHVLKSSDGEVLAAVMCGRLDLKREDGTPTGKQMLMVGYAVTKESARLKGFAREAYASAVLEAAKEAKKEGKELIYAAGEAVSTSEEFWNKVGWKRVYATPENAPTAGEQIQPARIEGVPATVEQTPAATTDGPLVELRYVQPALEEGSAAVPEHLMIHGFGNYAPDKEGILSTVRAFYEWNYGWARHGTDTGMTPAHKAHVDGIWDAFKKQVDQAGSLQFLSKDERVERQQRGVRIEEHKDADEQPRKTGTEDL